MWMLRRVNPYFVICGLLGLVVDRIAGSLPLYFAIGIVLGALLEGARRLGWIPPAPPHRVEPER